MPDFINIHCLTTISHEGNGEDYRVQVKGTWRKEHLVEKIRLPIIVPLADDMSLPVQATTK